jgi:hypothetical protein
MQHVEEDRDLTFMTGRNLGPVTATQLDDAPPCLTAELYEAPLDPAHHDGESKAASRCFARRVLLTARTTTLSSAETTLDIDWCYLNLRASPLGINYFISLRLRQWPLLMAPTCSIALVPIYKDSPERLPSPWNQPFNRCAWMVEREYSKNENTMRADSNSWTHPPQDQDWIGENPTYNKRWHTP